MDGLAIVFARVEHGGEVAAGDEGDFVSVAVVERGHQLAAFLILFAVVFQGQPTDGPGHFAIGTAFGEGFAAGAKAFRAIVVRFIFTEVAGGSDFNLVDAKDGDVGEEAPAETGGWGCPDWRIGYSCGESEGCSRGAGEKFTSGAIDFHSTSIL